MNAPLNDYSFLATEVDGLLDDKVDNSTLADYSLTITINTVLSTKANQSDVANDLALTANLIL